MDYSNNLIMLIEDDSLYRKYLARNIDIYLKSLTIEANDPADADMYLQNNRPDLILLDVQLPIMNGIDYLKKLRSNDKTKDLVVIPCTSNAAKPIVMEMMKYGISDFIEKKSHINIIVEKIKKALDQINLKNENNKGDDNAG
jgi:DNA-binding NtrC family response regulator